MPKSNDAVLQKALCTYTCSGIGRPVNTLVCTPHPPPPFTFGVEIITFWDEIVPVGMEVPSPTLVAGSIQNIKPLTIHLNILLVNIGKLIIN